MLWFEGEDSQEDATLEREEDFDLLVRRVLSEMLEVEEEELPDGVTFESAGALGVDPLDLIERLMEVDGSSERPDCSSLS